jgi:tetratricopeptide (TPR) repeat protein
MLLHFALWVVVSAVDRGALLRDALEKETRGDDAAALSALEALAQTHLDWELVRIEAARLRLKRGDELWRAQAHLEMARALAPENPRAHYLWGLLMEEQRNSKEATQAFRLALALRPDYHEARYRLGARLLSDGAFSEASTTLEEYARANPKEWGAQLLWAQALERAGHDDRAEAALKALLKDSPVRAVAGARLVALYERKGQKKKADAVKASLATGKARVMRPLKSRR